LVVIERDEKEEIVGRSVGRKRPRKSDDTIVPSDQE
jgi:hypothetical protein